MSFSRPPARCSPRARARWRGVAWTGGLLILCALAVGPTAPGEKTLILHAGRETMPKDKLATVPFEDGETLTYTIAWLKIEGGEMTIGTAREVTPEGVPLHRISLAANSNDYVSKFYPVRTRYESWVDARDLQPIRFEKHAREGRYESDEVEEFDLTRRVAVWRDESSVRATSTLPERFQDVISSFYYLRTQQLVPGQDIRMELYSRGKVYRLIAAVLGKEKVETDAGTWDAIKVQPRMHESESAEDRNKGKLFLWFSDDARRLPVMARTILPIGSVTARLKRVSGREQISAAPGGPAAR